MSNASNYHVSVLLNESIDYLITDTKGVYVDVTFGAGGHSKQILKKLHPDGKLIAFDQDEDAHKNILNEKNFMLLNENFRYIKNFLRLHGIQKIHGLIADLGVSSYQFDNPNKGFTYREEAPLDMRMSSKIKQGAKEIVANYSEDQLTYIFKNYGELKKAKLFAQKITQHRSTQPIITNQDFIETVKPILDKKDYFKELSQLFQSLRIEVNQELEALKDLLNHCVDLIIPKGRLVVISYHSLEDRLVKNFLRYGSFDAHDFTKDMFGNILRPFDPMFSKPIIPTEDEIKINIRSRSAKMRIGIKR